MQLEQRASGHRADQLGLGRLCEQRPQVVVALGELCREVVALTRCIVLVDGALEATGSSLDLDLGLGRWQPLRYPTESTISRDRLGNWARNSARSVFSCTTRWAYSSARPVASYNRRGCRMSMSSASMPGTVAATR